MLNTACSPFSSATCLDDRKHLLLELPLQVVLQLGHLGLGVLLRELDVALRLVDVLLELCARGLAQHGGAVLELCLHRLKLLGLVVDLGDLLRVQVGQLLRRLFAGGRCLGDHLKVHERDLRTLREGRGRLWRRRGRRRRGRRGRLGRRRLRSRRLRSGRRRLRSPRSAARRRRGAGPAVNTNISARALSDIFDSFI